MKVADLFAKLSLKPDKRSFDAGNKLLGTVKTAIAGIVAFKGIKLFADMVDDTAQLADQFAKMSKQIGISVEGLQQLEFAAKLTGSDIGVLRTGLQRFARTASDADRGLTSAADSFDRAGVSVKDASGELKQVDVLMEDVADQFAAMPDGTKKTALAMELFGRAGAQLIPLLNEGKDGIRKYREEFTQLGGEVSTSTARDFEEYNDTMLRIKTVLIGLRTQAVSALLPLFQDASKRVLDWVKANREFLKQRIQDIMKKIFVAGQQLIVIVGKLISVFAFLAEHALAVKIAIGVIIAAIVALKVAMLAAAAPMIAAGLATAAAWIAAAAPFLLIGLLIAGLVLIVEDLWTALTGGESVLADLFDAVTDWVADKIFGTFKEVASGIRFLWDKLFEWIDDKIQGAIDAAVRFKNKALDLIGLGDDEPLSEETAGAIADRLAGGIDLIGRAPEFIQQGARALSSATNITVNTQPGADAEQIATDVGAAIDESNQRLARELQAAQ